MSHDIQSRDIQVGTTMAWHGKTKIETKIDRSNCGIVYPMEKRPLLVPNGVDDNGLPKFIPTEHYSIVSLDDCLPIGNPVKAGYKLITNEQFMEMIENSLAGTKHEIVSVGSIGNREKVFCSIKLDDNFVAAGRDTENVLNVLWGHGGVFGLTYRSGFTVVVCANTFAVALRSGGATYQKHTGNAELKLENMGKAIEEHYGVAAEFKRAMNEFAGTSISKSDANALFAGFTVRENPEKIEDVSVRTQNIISSLYDLFNTGKGNTGQNRADAFNALTDYYTHESSGGEDTWKQFESSEFGSGFNRKSEAYNLLRGEDVKGLGDFDEVIKRGTRVLELVN